MIFKKIEKVLGLQQLACRDYMLSILDFRGKLQFFQAYKKSFFRMTEKYDWHIPCSCTMKKLRNIW